MASRLARSAFGASRGLRPVLASQTPRAASIAAVQVRESSNIPSVDPKTKAQSLLDAVPGNNIATKAAVVSTATVAGIYALSNEFYVVNEETVVAFCLLSVWAGLIKYGGPVYSEWAEGHSNRIKNLLLEARAQHTQAVKDRIDNVKEMGGVVDVTKTLFEVSKETAQLEAKAYELEQTTAIAAEAKSVLDSWVRYESQVKQRQQKELAEAVINKVKKELENPKNLQQILQQSVADVEKILAKK